MWGHAPWGTRRGGTSAHFLQSFENAFKGGRKNIPERRVP